MLPRKVIIENYFTFIEVMSIRSFNKELLENIWFVSKNGKKAQELLTDIELLKASKNIVSGKFAKASKEEKELLKEESIDIGKKIEEKEIIWKALEKEIQNAEQKIPNVPAVDIPLRDGLSEEELKYKKLILSRANRLVFEENDHVLKAMMALI